MYALAAGSPAMRTHERIADAANANLLSPAVAHELRDAYEFISYVRLEHQVRAIQAGEEPNNNVSPAELTSLERRHLRDAFGVLRTVQQQLAQRYPAARV